MFNESTKFSLSCLIILSTLFVGSVVMRHHQPLEKYTFPEWDNDLSLWIDEQQVKRFSGYSMRIFAIDNGRVSPHLKSRNFNHYLPIIPSEVSSVNFTWRSGTKKYHYHFDRLQSFDETILKPPTVSIKIKGKVPQEAKGEKTKNELIILGFDVGLN